jgi:hypothetical protein
VELGADEELPPLELEALFEEFDALSRRWAAISFCAASASACTFRPMRRDSRKLEAMRPMNAGTDAARGPKPKARVARKSRLRCRC